MSTPRGHHRRSMTGLVACLVAAGVAACGGDGPAPGAPAADVPAGLAVPPERLTGTTAGRSDGSAPGSAADVLALIPDDAIRSRETRTNELSGEFDGEAVGLSRDLEVAGIPCAAGVLDVLSDSWGCDLSRDFELGGMTSAAGTYLPVHYGTGGRVAASGDALLPPVEMIELGGVACGDWASFHPDGTLAVCDLIADHMIGPLLLIAGSTVTLRPDGTVEMAIIYEPHEFGGTTYAPGTVEFDERGAVTMHAEDVFGE